MRAAILLAAGASRRFGRRDKLREMLAGRRLLDHAVAQARASGAHRLLLVSSCPPHIPGVTHVRARNATDGLAASLSDKADIRLAFGTATWPHQLVRVMLLEQLYRATTILAGHPYHRA